jgi:hypothetical protein
MVLVLLIMFFNHDFGHLPLDYGDSIPKPWNAIDDHSFNALDYVVFDHGFNHLLFYFGEIIFKPTNVFCDHGLDAFDYDLAIVLVIFL